MDAKNRFLLPAALKKQFPDGAEKFIVSRGREGCLIIYTLALWEQIEKELTAKGDNDPKIREFKAVLYDSTYEVELDAAGRAMLQGESVEYAGLKKEVMLASYGDRIQIWDLAKYKQRMAKIRETSFIETADALGLSVF